MIGACGCTYFPQVDSILVPEREMLRGAVAKRLRQGQRVDVPEYGVDLGRLPQLSNINEGIRERGDASDVAHEYDSLLTRLVVTYYREITNMRRVVNNAACARHFVCVRPDVDKIP
jgi:hypothetical protein